MSESIYKTPDDLIDIGFEREEDGSCDSERWVWFKKEIVIGNTNNYFEIVVTYSLSISDDPYGSYDENFRYSHKKTECFLKDENGNSLFQANLSIKQLSDFDKLDYMFSS
jgi:hypothetical protein